MFYVNNGNNINVYNDNNLSIINNCDKIYENYNITDNRPMINLKINNVVTACLLDTGAKISVIKYELLKRIGKFTIINSDINVKCANNSSLKIMGKVYLNVKLNEKMENIDFYVAKEISPPVICGINLLNKFNIKLTINEIYNEKSVNVIEFKSKALEFENIKDETILKILKKYESIIMKHKWDIGKTDIVKHEIITNSKPIATNPRRQPYHLVEKIEQNIKEMES